MTFTRKGPRVVFYKANFDAAFIENDGVASIGIAVRDSNANSIAALSKRIRMPHSVELAKALACSRAVSFARELSFF